MLKSSTYGRVGRGCQGGDLMADDDGWKEQLAFVSGYILVFGFALLKLWPLAAGFQTGMNVNLWTTNLPSQGVTTALWVYWGLTSVLGLALTAVSLAIGHIMCRGLWLAFFSGPSANPLVVGASHLLDRLRLITYDAAFFLLLYAGFGAVLGVMIMISAGFESALVSSLSLSLKAAGWIARSLVMIVLLAF